MTKSVKIAHGVTIGGQTGTQHDTFKVVSAKNSTEYLPGRKLSRREVDELCADRRWDVTLVPLNNVEHK